MSVMNNEVYEAMAIFSVELSHIRRRIGYGIWHAYSRCTGYLLRETDNVAKEIGRAHV